MSQPHLLDKMRNVIRLHQYSLEAEKAYLLWVRRFILFHNEQHPKKTGKCEAEAFLTHLAENRSVSPATQNLALSSILFLYQKVLEVELPWLDDVVRAKPRTRGFLWPCGISWAIPANVCIGSTSSPARTSLPILPPLITFIDVISTEVR